MPDYAALAAEHGGVPDYAALAAEHGGTVDTPTADFKSTNEKDAQGNAVVRGVSSAWDWLNHSVLGDSVRQASDAIANSMDMPALDRSPAMARIRGFAAGATQGIGGLAESMTSPLGIALTLTGLGGDSAALRAIPGAGKMLALPEVQALKRAVQGLAGAGYAIEGGNKVVTAPTLGEKAQGLAEMAGGAAGALTAARPSLAQPAGARPSRLNLTPEEQAANSFATERGIPLDAATATGNRFVKGVQKVTGESLLGSIPAEKAQRAQTAALQRVGTELADQTGTKSPQTPEDAGVATRGAAEELVRNLSKQSDEAYGRLRAVEAMPEHARDVVAVPTGRILSKMKETGELPTRDEIHAMRQIETELDAVPYQEGGTVQNASRNAGTENDWTDGDMRRSSFVRARGGAPVYGEILQAAPGTSEATRGEVLNAVRKTLETGQWTDMSKGALAVARDRLRTGYEGPNIPQGQLGKAERVALPVDLKDTKSSLQGLYDQWKRESEIVPLSMSGDKGRAFAALDRLMNGPDVAPASVVDQALSSLKGLARGANMPELRTSGQGGAAFAVSKLDDAVRAAVSRAGPEALTALEEGRSAHKAMRGLDPIIEQLQKEPVQVYRKLTAPGDTQVGLLRQVSEAAPNAMPDIARAWLDERLNLATERGRFDHADKLYADWRKLGPETKKELFPSESHRASLEHFFQLAKRMAENPNPSGTAPTLMKGGELVGLATHPLATLPPSLVMGGVSKMLYSPRGAAALARYLERTKPVKSSVVSAAVKRSALVELLAAARSAGIQVPAMASGSTDATEEQRSGTPAR